MDKPILAICYDFDKTLSPDDMQAQGYIQSIGYKVEEFWKESNKRAEDDDMDQNLSYMYMMADKSRGKVLFTKEKLREYGSAVVLFPDVNTWFDRINAYGTEKGVLNVTDQYRVPFRNMIYIGGSENAVKVREKLNLNS